MLSTPPGQLCHLTRCRHRGSETLQAEMYVTDGMQRHLPMALTPTGRAAQAQGGRLSPLEEVSECKQLTGNGACPPPAPGLQLEVCHRTC